LEVFVIIANLTAGFPETGSLLSSITVGSASIMALGEEAF
jgi:hypothetical protein